MGKFSDYVATIKQQTNNLREVVSAKSGVDCSDYSIMQCAGTINSLNIETQQPLKYERPEWYPDIESILMSAPDIVKDNKTYYPLYILLLEGCHISDNFYAASVSTSTAPNFYSGTGCNAYIFSDVVNNNPSNISEETLEVGAQITHIWDKAKDITHDTHSVRWVICYNNTKEYINMSCRGYMPVIEVVIKQGSYNNILNGNMTGSSSSRYNILKYLKFCEDVYMSYDDRVCYHMEGSMEKFVNNSRHHLIFNSSAFSYMYQLKEFENNGTIQFKNAFFTNSLVSNIHLDARTVVTGDISNCDNLKSITIDKPNLNSGITNCPNLTHLELLNTTTISIVNGYLGSSCRNLTYVKIPSTLTVWEKSNSNTFGYCRYIELFNDFNVVGVNFTGAIPKYIQWLKDLCIWLKDRTGEEAGSMVIGATNLDNASNIYLTFNTSNKRNITFDGVTAETPGAISITEFITTQLNWTLS